MIEVVFCPVCPHPHPVPPGETKDVAQAMINNGFGWDPRLEVWARWNPQVKGWELPDGRPVDGRHQFRSGRHTPKRGS